ncbi:sulfatase-like hydrolase/transferase, partial [Parvimonas sp. D9]|uniref:sulfatase-like hydrolase/transferase n=1 Tax=Parvimonas sp. D9 TaxID=3110689 RepID=UPI003A7F55E4
MYAAKFHTSKFVYKANRFIFPLFSIYPSNMKKYLLLIWLLPIIVTAQQRPNIIYIMSDDHDANAISAYGSQLLATPNIDRLAKEGMLF